MLYDSIVLLICYLIGAIPFGILVAKAFKIEDLRSRGSGNIGATNAWRVGGKKVGIITFLCDFMKCFIPVIIIEYNCGTISSAICGGVIVLGHIFPIWLKFKGGKGIASLFGLLLAVTPMLALVIAGIWLLLFKIYKISSLSSLVSMSVMVLLSLVFCEWYIIYIYFILYSIIIFNHIGNIKRLILKEEKSI